MNRVDRYLWNKVDKDGPADCWIWTGGTSLGYGRVGCRIPLTESGTDMAHRLTYELLVGPIPPYPDYHLDHTCRVTLCVNPDHLEVVTAAENTRRGLHGVLRTHCKNGHALTEDNVQRRRWDDQRRCKTCYREAMRTKRAAVRAELALGGMDGET